MYVYMYICMDVYLCMYNTGSVCMYVVFIYFDLRTNKHSILYIFMMECMKCGGVKHMLCALYGRWQGRIHYPTVRVGFLTGSVAWRFIPLSKRRVTVLAWPLQAAKWRVLRPHYNRDTQTQTDRQTDRRRLATEGHTDRQGTLTLPEHYTREEQAHMYVCMYVYTCEDSAINYVEIDVGILVL